MRLRGHHLFCASLFQGKGYNGAFAARMGEVLAALSRGEAFLLCEGCDSLCAACPNCRPGNQCALGTEDAARRDAAAFAAVGLIPGQRVVPEQAGERLRCVTEAQWKSVCEGCRWQREGLCSWGLFQKMRSSALCNILEKGSSFGKSRGFPFFFEIPLAFKRRIY